MNRVAGPPFDGSGVIRNLNLRSYAYKKSSAHASLKTFADDLRLLPVSDRTQQSYWACVRKLSEHFAKAPQDVSPEELRQYFIFLTGPVCVSHGHGQSAAAALARRPPALDLSRQPDAQLRSRYELAAGQQLDIKGVTLHSYRYAWAERAKTASYPERFAQEALGHNSKAVHRANAKRALVKTPSLEEYEKRSEPHAVPSA